MSRIEFIHLGMMKTATTYMQQVWNTDPAYALSYRGNVAFVEQLREEVRLKRTQGYVQSEINTDSPYVEGQKIVVSNEGFSTAFLNEPEYQTRIPDFIEFASRNLGRLSDATSNILLVVREPLSWIRSIYNQSIKQGWSGNIQQFIDQQTQFLIHSFDVEYLVRSYSRYFDNILILPYEIMKNDESLFWEIISHTFDIDKPKVTVEKSQGVMNESIGTDRLYLLSKLHGMSELFINFLQNADEIMMQNEKQTLIDHQVNYGKWVHRIFVEFAEQEKIDALIQWLDLTGPDEEFFEFRLPAALIQAIENKYIKYLQNNIVREYPDYYAEMLEKFTQS